MRVAERFWAKVDKSGDCWEWTGAMRPNGYGGFAITKLNTHAAHRASWLINVGPVPAGMDVCHHCDNRRCVRPSHLFLGTRQDNMRDAAAKGRLGHNPNQARGARHPKMKIDHAMAAAIIEMVSGGATIADASRRFGVTRSNIRAVLIGDHWTARESQQKAEDAA